MKWFLKSLISLTDQIEPSGSDRTSSSIDLIFSVLTDFEPNFIMIQTRIWFHPPSPHKNEFLIFHFNIEIPKKSNTFEQYSNFIHHSNRLWETNNMWFIKHWNSKMSNFGEIIFYSPLPKYEFHFDKISYTFSLMIVYFQQNDRSFKIWGSYTLAYRILSVSRLYTDRVLSAKLSYTFNFRIVYFQPWSYTIRVTRT